MNAGVSCNLASLENIYAVKQVKWSFVCVISRERWMIRWFIEWYKPWSLHEDTVEVPPDLYRLPWCQALLYSIIIFCM